MEKIIRLLKKELGMLVTILSKIANGTHCSIIRIRNNRVNNLLI